ncbi:MAG: GDP-mannose 4,6-dehydratase [Desulfovibrionaceae bacterium]
MKKALITGVTGQDGSYLVEFLLEKGYEVHGIRRRVSNGNINNIRHISRDPRDPHHSFKLHYGDMTDSSNLNRLIRNLRPDEIYNLAAQSHVHVSFEVPEYTAEVVALGTLRLLDAIKEYGGDIKFYQASTSELYGKALATPQDENTPFNPQSPYAIAKQYAHYITSNYRDAYGLFACNGILFNHESPRRGENFVTRKITTAAANIYKKKQKKMFLGNLNAVRDWGYALDYVKAMWMMLQHDIADDYVVATGEAHSVREFVEKSFAYVDIMIEWQGEGVNEKGINTKSGEVVVEVDPYYFRPTEVEYLLGDSSKARRELCWQPSVGFEALVELMMAADLDDN